MSHSGPGHLVDGDEVPHRVLGRADAARRLDAAVLAGGAVPVAHGLQHHLHDGQGGGGGDLAGGGLDHVGAREQREPGGAAHVVVARQLAGLQDDLEVGAAAGLLDGDDLVVHLAVAAGEEGAAVDHHVDLAGARVDGERGVGQLDRQRRPARRERRGHRRDDDAGAAQPLDRHAGEVGVDADRGDRRDVGVVGVGPHGLRAQRPDLAGRVGALQRGQVDHGDGHVDGLQLGGLLDRAGGEHGRAALQPDLVDAGQPGRKRRSAVSSRTASASGAGTVVVTPLSLLPVIAAGGTSRRSAAPPRAARRDHAAVWGAVRWSCAAGPRRP